MKQLGWLFLIGLVIGAVLMIVDKSKTDQQPCNAVGAVRYIGDRKYVCEQTTLNGPRWQWKF